MTEAGVKPLAAVRQRVVDELRDRIITGRLKPGDRLVERDLAEDLGVSRLPVREAIRALESEGFLETPSPRRVVVRQLSRVDVEELFDVREALEVLAAGLAAERAGEAGRARLEAILDEAAAATRSGQGSRITEANNRFHDEILAVADHRLLSTLMQPLEGRLAWLTGQNEHWEDLLAEHRRLYEAIASGDAERARACALEHVRVNREVTLSLLFPV
ncbi:MULTISPECIES: GntR family transcriptional regulator [Amycolatopsis]|uniref:DNA-binding transcriptional regulator, GntR family n=2 Tax=Amycolatopsis TaxID=1813 RepID=A0A1I3XXT6_9PSEU|nr:GntR family transcriptional regulator [Amycolatopsis sacchari]SFK24388.1 DNA-binding transcriptional regulator, GntR family [Amycolatopsis sacchari]